jgi:hypothetical protein
MCLVQDANGYQERAGLEGMLFVEIELQVGLFEVDLAFFSVTGDRMLKLDLGIEAELSDDEAV